MPKNEIDYSNTIIYKIYCKDQSINDVYVGHTTSFIKRKYQHKISCNNVNNTLPIYKIIKANGGWENWIMTEIARYNCKNSGEAKIKEQQHYEIIKILPQCIDKVETYCEIYNEPITTNIHKINAKSTVNDKNAEKFYCNLCDLNPCNKSDYTRHLQTQKHKNNVLTTNDNVLTTIDNAKNAKKYVCKFCQKFYNDRAGLWRHNKKCNIELTNEKCIDEPTDKELIVMLLKQHTKIMEQNTELIEVMKNGTHNTITHNTITHSNSNNKTFNLNLFLNETCKDAMNIMDFVDSIKLQLSDLERVGEIGFVEGISNIITTNLKALDVSQRPIHCTDKKREVLYIKDENKWEKDEEKNKIRKVVKKVANKNSRLLQQFKEAHPDCGKSASIFSDQYNKLIIEAMGGSGDNDLEKENKIIQIISKNVIIDKE